MNNDEILSIPRLFASIKREFLLVIAVLGLFLGLALLYLFMTKPLYTAQTSILLDPAKAAAVSEISSKARGRFESPAIVSKMEVMKSRRVSLQAYNAVMKNNQAQIDEGKLNVFRKGLKVFREGDSYVLSVRYTAKSPEMAANGANAFAQAYVDDQLNSFSEDAGKTEGWLKEKIETLRQQSVAANMAVQDFRKENNIIQSNGGRSINDQQLANINNRIGDVKAEVASKRVQYLHARNIVEKRDINAAVAQAFDNDVINNIRAEYLSDKQRLLKLRRNLGDEHKTVKNLDSKLAESRSIIFSEMKRITQSFKSEYEVALAKESSLKGNLDSLVGEKINNDGHSFELDALEKEAESFSALYDEYLQKYQTMQQQQSFPMAEASIISKAVAPKNKSHPKIPLILGMALILGGGLGVLLALVKDNMDSSFKRAGQVESSTDLHFLGFFPKTKKHLGASHASSFGDATYAQSVDEPSSVQAETCQKIEVALQRKAPDTGGQVIGVSADNPHDAKSVTAANLALHLASSGHKCLLIDADVRNPDLTDQNIGNVKAGLNAVLASSSTPSQAIRRDTKTQLHILPAELLQEAGKPNLVHTKAMRQLIRDVKGEFDYVVVNLPAMSATSDASSSIAYVDHFLFVLEWAKSKPNAFNFMLKTNDIPKDKALGVVLGQADMKQLARNYGHKVHKQYTKAA